MKPLRRSRSAEGREILRVPYRGPDLLRQAIYNRGSAFTLEDRRALGVEGLLPAVVSSQDLQAQRINGHLARKDDALEKYIGLAALQDRNEYLFYRVLIDNLEDLLPIVYTPTVGQASKRYSHIFRRGRGIWITPEDRGRIREVLASTQFADVKLVVATDNQAILGIGDQGAGGMVIPIGKLAIYCAAAGIHPAETLPVSLDVGTNNRRLLDDELYMGWRHERLAGSDYFDFLEEFVDALTELFPDALLQWEDFGKSNAFTLLERYRDRVLSFNDDIQGTGAMTLAGILAAQRISGRELADERFVIVGGGAAGMGIAQQLHVALEEAGVAGDDLTAAIAVLDSRGLIVDDRDGLDGYKKRWAWPATLAASLGVGGGASERDLESVVKALRPTALIGTSGQTGLFSEAIVREMASHVERPAIFPLSNPNDLAEAQPQDLARWTDGRALVATGSPFPPVRHEGREFHVGQGNNALIFPAIGLGVLLGGARSISDGMFTAAARALAAGLTQEELESGRLYPAISRLRDVTLDVAVAVVRQAAREGLGNELSADDVARVRWTPEYPELIPI